VVKAAAKIAIIKATRPIPYFFIIITDAFMIQKATKTFEVKKCNESSMRTH
jgi:hypothetical protein